MQPSPSTHLPPQFKNALTLCDSKSLHAGPCRIRTCLRWWGKWLAGRDGHRVGSHLATEVTVDLGSGASPPLGPPLFDFLVCGF